VCLPVGIAGEDGFDDERPPAALAAAIGIGRPTASRLPIERQRRPQGAKPVTGHAGLGAERRAGMCLDRGTVVHRS